MRLAAKFNSYYADRPGNSTFYFPLLFFKLTVCHSVDNNGDERRKFYATTISWTVMTHILNVGLGSRWNCRYSGTDNYSVSDAIYEAIGRPR